MSILIVLKEAVAQRQLITNIRKKQLLFYYHIARREQLAYVVTIGNLCRKKEKEKQKKILDILLS